MRDALRWVDPLCPATCERTLGVTHPVLVATHSIPPVRVDAHISMGTEEASAGSVVPNSDSDEIDALIDELSQGYGNSKVLSITFAYVVVSDGPAAGLAGLSCPLEKKKPCWRKKVSPISHPSRMEYTRAVRANVSQLADLASRPAGEPNMFPFRPATQVQWQPNVALREAARGSNPTEAKMHTVAAESPDRVRWLAINRQSRLGINDEFRLSEDMPYPNLGIVLCPSSRTYDLTACIKSLLMASSNLLGTKVSHSEAKPATISCGCNGSRANWMGGTRRNAAFHGNRSVSSSGDAVARAINVRRRRVTMGIAWYLQWNGIHKCGKKTPVSITRGGNPKTVDGKVDGVQRGCLPLCSPYDSSTTNPRISCALDERNRASGKQYKAQ
ncbi:hypothetical protein EDB86DRAFT_3201591 [Lactarius hatsudake]|nr:hypothetical protein EDB86DRAFT_3201591 [Lactarius hatsudake]